METIEVIGIVVGAVAAVLGGVWFIIQRAMNAGKDAHRLDIVEKETSVNTYEIDIIKKWIIKLDINMIDGFAPKCSPRRLNAIGKKLIEVSGAGDILPAIGHLLMQQMEQKSIKTAFDAETEAYFIMMGNDSNEAYNKLKNYIYNQPSEIELEVEGSTTLIRLDYDTIVRIVSLNLRDMYLEAHPEL